jgi:hypothetical protein
MSGDKAAPQLGKPRTAAQKEVMPNEGRETIQSRQADTVTGAAHLPNAGVGGREQSPWRELIQRVKYLLEWMPVCSAGSSGYTRRAKVEESLTIVAELLEQKEKK